MASKDERDQQCKRQQEGEEDSHPLSMGLIALDEEIEHAPAHTAGFLLCGSASGECAMTNQMPLCPVCDGVVYIPSDAMENELVSCAECGTELEIMCLAPIELELAPEVEEDWGE